MNAPRLCRVYWGSHGCDLPKGHHLGEGPDRFCRCDCVDSASELGDGGVLYYGPDTRLYGEDVLEVWGVDPTRAPGLPRISESPRWEEAVYACGAAAATLPWHPDYQERL